MHMKDIGPVTKERHKKQDKMGRMLAFDSTAGKIKTFIWRFDGDSAREERDRWIKGLKRHQKAVRELKDYFRDDHDQ